MLKKAIVVSHIGTSVLDVVENEIKVLVSELSDQSGINTVLAFSSKRAIKKLSKHNIDVAYIEEAIADLVAQGYSVTILPLHLVKGNDYLKLQDISRQYSDVLVLSPLLASDNNVNQLAKVVFEKIVEKCCPVLFVGHGTDNEHLHSYDKFLEAYKSLNNETYLMTLNSDIDKIVSKLPDEIVLFPLFSINGYHVSHDLFNKDDSIYHQINSSDIKVHQYKNGLISYPEVRKIYLNQALNELGIS